MVLSKGIEKVKQRGMVFRSSKFLVNKMLSKIDFSKDLKIIQLGVGTGVFTKGILKKMSKNSKLYAFEIDKNSRKYVENIKDTRLIYIEKNAEYIEKYVKEEVDAIISTLPFASLPSNFFNTVLKSCKNKLKKHGIFLQYQYFLSHKKRIEKLFEKNVEIDFELKNFPPAFIYKVTK